MRDDTVNSIKQLVNLIDERAKEPIDLDQLAKEVGISKYYLHRLFKSITNRSLMTYVRDRRLSLSVYHLMHSSLNIIDIATEYQFEYEQSYIRAFKKKYNVTPAQYRRCQMEIPIEQKLDLNLLHEIGDGLMVEPRMCVKPKFCVRGLESEIVHTENLVHMTTNRQAEEVWKDYLPYMKHVINPNIYIGLVRYTKNPEYSNYYLSGTEVALGTLSEAPLVSYEIDSYEYAVFRYVGMHSPHSITFRALLTIYRFIDDWKRRTHYQQAAPFHFERVDLEICKDDYCEMDIYMPITIKN